MTAEKNGELSVAKTNIVINSPAVAVVMSSKLRRVIVTSFAVFHCYSVV
jgi:hypothetical protein